MSDVSEIRLRPSPTSNPPAGQACPPSPPSLRPRLVETGLAQARPQVIQQAQPSRRISGQPLGRPAAPRLSPACPGQVCLTCLRLGQRPAPQSGCPSNSAQAGQACSRLAPSHPAPAALAQSQTGLKVCQPETSLRPSPSARLLACLTCLRLASGPATCYPASAHAATRPSTAQPAQPKFQAAQPPMASQPRG